MWEQTLYSSPLALFTWDFQVCEGDSYLCKWFSPLNKLEVVETDYHHDIWDYIVAGGQRSRITEISHSCVIVFSSHSPMKCEG